MQVDFKCASSTEFLLIGASTLTCMLNGQWDAPAPTCVECKAYHLINGEVNCNSGESPSDPLDHCVQLMGMTPVPASGYRFVRVGADTLKLWCNTAKDQDGGGESSLQLKQLTQRMPNADR